MASSLWTSVSWSWHYQTLASLLLKRQPGLHCTKVVNMKNHNNEGKKSLPTKERMRLMFPGPSEKESTVLARHRAIRQTEWVLSYKSRTQQTALRFKLFRFSQIELPACFSSRLSPANCTLRPQKESNFNNMKETCKEARVSNCSGHSKNKRGGGFLWRF